MTKSKNLRRFLMVGVFTAVFSASMGTAAFADFDWETAPATASPTQQSSLAEPQVYTLMDFDWE
jgi:hypothetical protein